MSADVWIKFDPCACCGRAADSGADLNVTYNLSRMLGEAGFWGWRNIIDKPAGDVGAHILAVLDGMAADPEKWRAMNPKNGWGDYDECLQGRMRRWAQECVEVGNRARIGGCL